MAYPPAHLAVLLLLVFLLLVVVLSSSMVDCDDNINQDFDITWGNDHAQILNNGELLKLSLDQSSGSGFQSKNQYLFGLFEMQLKLAPGNSAGTDTSFYSLQMIKLSHDHASSSSAPATAVVTLLWSPCFS
ncbi:hypothetical protein HYC85_007730 [Camellia sinensis]|uniref:GH16 domain-containing protein n=1 Tax=Camellia sinensis TaxID=4442 RepID=A0A7J7HS74_CAMSI|nr:hypothetical protein HYC85_007730 [Camellia sinensis]